MLTWLGRIGLQPWLSQASSPAISTSHRVSSRNLWQTGAASRFSRRRWAHTGSEEYGSDDGCRTGSVALKLYPASEISARLYGVQRRDTEGATKWRVAAYGNIRSESFFLPMECVTRALVLEAEPRAGANG